MTASADHSRHRFGILPRITFLIATLALAFAPSATGQSSREQVGGVQNFGRVTDRFFRGGSVTPEGVANLARMGVRTIVDLRDKESVGEAEAAERQGIKYFKFPMNGHATPDDKAVNEVLSIVENAKEPVYVHCSAGKHRAGTITALYRMRVQGWTKEKAWEEQQSYGFGPAQEHPELYAYVYGKATESEAASLAKAAPAERVREDKDISKSKDKKKPSKVSKEDSDDDDDDDDGDDDHDRAADKVKDKKHKHDSEHKHDSHSNRGKVSASPTARTADVTSEASPKAAEPSANAKGSLSHKGDYIAMSEAIKLARDAGGTGDVLKVDLEWDTARAITTWDLTFSSGMEYELDAASGKLLGTKQKLPAKIAVLSPLDLEGDSAPRLLSFLEIIEKAWADHGKPVLEMELKRIKGRAETLFEVLLEDGTTLYLDAATGGKVNGL